jgi:undecaprenyl-diphosphatase
MGRRATLAFARFDAAELKFCRYLNRSSRSEWVRQPFRAVSWLGDGWIWYALILALPLVLGFEGWQASAHVAATGALGLLLYKLIKSRAVRDARTSRTRSSSASRPLDRYSFRRGTHCTRFRSRSCSRTTCRTGRGRSRHSRSRSLCRA